MVGRRVWQMIRVDMHRAFSFRFLIAVLCIAGVMLIDNLWEIRYAINSSGYSVYYFFFNAIVFPGGLSVYCSAIFCALPFCREVFVERKNNVQEKYVGG